MILAEQIVHDKQLVIGHAVGKIAQTSQLFRDDGHLNLLKLEKLEQVAPETKQFIFEFIQNKTLPQPVKTEVSCVIKTLLTIPVPVDQVAYLKKVRPLIDLVTNGEASEKRHREAESVKVHEAIIGLANTGLASDYYMTPLMDFFCQASRQRHMESYVDNQLDACLEREHVVAAATFLANPENQLTKSEEVDKLLVLFKKLKFEAESKNQSCWWAYGPLIFFAEESNRSLDQSLFNFVVQAIDLTIQKDGLDEKLVEYICKFLVKGDNLKQFSHWFDAVYQTSSAAWTVLNNFFSEPKVWAGREQAAFDLREKAIAIKQWGPIIEQCVNPKVPILGLGLGEEAYDPQFMSKIIFDEIHGAHQTTADASLLRYMAHPVHFTDFYDQDTVDKTIAEKLANGSDSDYMAVLNYFNETEIKDFSTVVTDMAIKIANRISDRMLRAKALLLLRVYIIDEAFPLTLIESVPLNLVIVVVAFKLLGVNESVVQSWQLSDENIASLLPSLISLAEVPENKNVFAKINLPFIPRSREVGKKVLAEKIIQWLTKISFLRSVPKELGCEEIINEHLFNIQTLQQTNEITDTTDNISLTLMRKFKTELDHMDNQFVKKLVEIIKLNEGVTYDQVEQFIKDWDGDILSIIVLAAHYNAIYNDGLVFLGRKITEIIKKTAETNRYDLQNELTQRQLRPILLNSDVAEQKKAIDVWRDPGYTLKFELNQTEQINNSGYEITQRISSELSQRIAPQGQFHAEKIIQLLGANIDKNQAEKIVLLIVGCLQKNTDQPKNLIGQLVQEVKQSRLGKEHQTILIGLAQLFRELSIGKISAIDLATTTQKLIIKILADWPELAKTDLVDQDLNVYAINELNNVGGKLRSNQAELFVCYTTDSPKTLLEIGRYPNSGSCQNFESTGTYNTGLPGYVFDSHIQAACISSAIIPEKLKNDPDLLIGATITKVNLNLGSAELVLKDGQNFIIKLTKPIARRMIMLGSLSNDINKNVPTLVVEPTYADPGLIGSSVEQMLDEVISAKKRQLSTLLNVDVLQSNEIVTDSTIIIAGSHNPSGHYNDLGRGLSGVEGETYEIKLKSKKQ